MRRVVVIGDSLTFHGPVGPLPLHDPRLFPNLLATALTEATGDPWQAQVVARAGWGVREAWLALQRDVHLQQDLLIGADAAVFAVGSSDTLPVGIPRGLLATLPFVRPTSLRRRLRRGIDRVHPHLVRATGGRLRYTPLSVYRHGWRKSIDAVRLFTRDAPLCAVLPATHRGPYYAGNLRHHPQVRAATLTMADDAGVALVDLAALAAPHLDAYNPDGLHWPFVVHQRVAEAMAKALLDQL
ncbi:MAG TPA: GDSL-type esterase/lipase family protein [Egibacteraceae bacterium]|nr:GDSL-type esterase/lipase family protein [Egibacteraceae bacterium]